MAQHSITIAASPSIGDAQARWAPRLAAAWPRPSSPPTFFSLPLDALFETLLDEASATGMTNAGPLLVVLGPEVPGGTLLQLADRLQQRMVPAVLLLPAIDQHSRGLETGGLIVEAMDSDPALLAATLFTLAERQSTVRDLTRDLTIATRYQGGVRGEIDRIHDELHLAAAVQQEILPRRLPDRSGVQFGVLFRPAGYVSGDIYDIVDLDDQGRHVAFFIADAVGHGVPAALMTMVISRSLRMTRTEGGQPRIVSPAEAMTRLNEDLCRNHREAPRFTTAVYGIIDTHTRQVTLTGAGHPPPLRIRGPALQRVDTDGPLLGIFPGEKYADTTFRMAEDETLLLYSDGFETAFAPLVEGDTKRKNADAYLREMSALPWPSASRPGTAADALRCLEHRLDQQAGSLHQIDDVTALAICARAAAAQAPAAARRAA
jgi:serine phosphatase RsbU (regulator of sigma subunit)